MKSILFFSLILFVFVKSATAQQSQLYTVNGSVIDAEEGSALPGLTVILQHAADTTDMVAGTSNTLGSFSLKVQQAGSYFLRLSFVGYETHTQQVLVDSTTNFVGTIGLKQTVKGLGEVVVEEVQERFRINGDTTIFNADAYKVNPDASAEDLVTKLPGVVMQDGQVEAQGEQVQRVTVDGREFFGDDPTVALRN
nr:carboxypeptidase-like regulatory domain-containing protein [Rhodothermaceae bacterium]